MLGFLQARGLSTEGLELRQTVTTDPTMVVRSLGDLPLYGHGQHVAHEINRVLVRSAMLAGALADVAGLSSEPDAEAPD